MRPRGMLATAALVLATLPLLPVQMLAVRFGWALSRRIPVLWHRLALRCLGLKVTEFGEPGGGQPLLIVSNHVSWADICVLASRRPLSFIAKSDVMSWPVFGLFARLQRCVFVDRQRRSATGATASEIAARLTAGDALVLFAEGTTSDGNRVLPFRSALLGAARHALDQTDHAAVWVQPVAIVYTRHHGVPLGRPHRPLLAWPGDVTLLPHLAGVLDRGAFDAELVWGTPVAFDEMTDRKVLTARLEAMVSRMVAARLAGAPDP